MVVDASCFASSGSDRQRDHTRDEHRERPQQIEVQPVGGGSSVWLEGLMTSMDVT